MAMVGTFNLGGELMISNSDERGVVRVDSHHMEGSLVFPSVQFIEAITPPLQEIAFGLKHQQIVPPFTVVFPDRATVGKMACGLDQLLQLQLDVSDLQYTLGFLMDGELLGQPIQFTKLNTLFGLSRMLVQMKHEPDPSITYDVPSEAQGRLEELRQFVAQESPMGPIPLGAGIEGDMAAG